MGATTITGKGLGEANTHIAYNNSAEHNPRVVAAGLAQFDTNGEHILAFPSFSHWYITSGQPVSEAPRLAVTATELCDPIPAPSGVPIVVVFVEIYYDAGKMFHRIKLKGAPNKSFFYMVATNGLEVYKNPPLSVS